MVTSVNKNNKPKQDASSDSNAFSFHRCTFTRRATRFPTVIIANTALACSAGGRIRGAQFRTSAFERKSIVKAEGHLRGILWIIIYTTCVCSDLLRLPR